MPILNPSASVDLTTTNNNSTLVNTNLLQPTGFKMTINRKNFPNVEFFCQSFDHPSVSARPATTSYKRINNIGFSPDKFEFSELNINLLMDEDLNAYAEIFNWMERMVEVNDQTPSGVTDYGTKPPTYSDITLSILNSKNNTTRNIRYTDAFPVSIGNIAFETTAGGDQFIICPVTFKYTYFDFT